MVNDDVTSMALELTKRVYALPKALSSRESICTCCYAAQSYRF